MNTSFSSFVNLASRKLFSPMIIEYVWVEFVEIAKYLSEEQTIFIHLKYSASSIPRSH